MPCSPGMSACKSSCAHRLWVQEHRTDRAVWEVARDNAGLGYKQETQDWEKDNPSPRLRDKMLHREKPPEMLDARSTNEEINAVRRDDIEAQVFLVEAEQARAEAWRALAPQVPDTAIGNPMAEEALIATALFSQRGAQVLRTLDPEEFQQPLNRHVAAAIGHLESYGVRANAVAVETYMRGEPQNIPGMVQSRTGILHGQLAGARIASTLDWDSSLPLGNVDRTQYGLQRWESMANPPVMAPSFRDEVHNQYVAHKTEEAYRWGAQALRSAHESPEGTTPETTVTIQQQVQNKLPRPVQQDIPRLKPSLPSQQVSTTHSRRRA